MYFLVSLQQNTRKMVIHLCVFIYLFLGSVRKKTFIVDMNSKPVSHLKFD